jgi:hypothetical protein
LIAGVRSKQRRSEVVAVQFAVGDQVVAESESTVRPARRGVVEEVLRREPHPRYRIRWEDGRETVYTPAAGALRAAPVKTTA